MNLPKNVDKPLLSLCGVGLCDGLVLILKEIDIQIFPGEFITIVGPNGAGKSTLLKIMAGIRSQTSGKYIRDKGLKVSYVPQKFTPSPDMPMRVLDFIQIGNESKGNEIESFIKAEELSEIQFSRLSDLSGGELQKVLFARAIFRKPDLLLLDEPAQNLDYRNLTRFYERLTRYHRDTSIAVVLVSHDQFWVSAESSRVICLQQHICCQGPPGDLSANESLVAVMGKEFVSKIRPYSHSHDHEHGLANSSNKIRGPQP